MHRTRVGYPALPVHLTEQSWGPVDIRHSRFTRRGGRCVLVPPGPIAAAVRNHTRLEKLSLERNGLNEAALVTIAAACAKHPSLGIVAVASQCKRRRRGR